MKKTPTRKNKTDIIMGKVPIDFNAVPNGVPSQLPPGRVKLSESIEADTSVKPNKITPDRTPTQPISDLFTAFPPSTTIWHEYSNPIQKIASGYIHLISLYDLSFSHVF
jgi:hypothetical protein